MSAIAGVFPGDVLFFAAMNRLGPRRTALPFATHSVFSALLGVLLLGEHLSLKAILGSVMVFGGVLLAIAFGRKDGNTHHWILPLPWRVTRQRPSLSGWLGWPGQCGPSAGIDSPCREPPPLSAGPPRERIAAKLYRLAAIMFSNHVW